MAISGFTNPYLTTSNAGSFYATSDGYVQGMYKDDPAVVWQLANGILATTETIPMWGGVGIFVDVPTPGSVNPSLSLGGIVGRATTLTATSATGLAGFSVFNQNYSAFIDPGGSTVPLVGNGGQVNYFRLGSRARIPVQADPSLVSLEGGAIGANVSWDFNSQRLQPYDASTATYAINTATWSGNVLTIAMTAALGFTPSPGDVLTISGATNSGTGGASAVNTSFTVLTGTDSSNFTLSAPAASGVFGTIGGSPVIAMGTGALNVRVLEVVTSGNMTVNWNGSAATWNQSGPVALIEI